MICFAARATLRAAVVQINQHAVTNQNQELNRTGIYKNSVRLIVLASFLGSLTIHKCTVPVYVTVFFFS